MMHIGSHGPAWSALGSQTTRRSRPGPCSPIWRALAAGSEACVRIMPALLTHLRVCRCAGTWHTGC